MDRSFDVEYWQRLGPEAIFEAAWQMVVDAHSHDGSSAELHFEELLSIFTENNVRYLIVGGHAVMLYTEPRYTKDLDIWVEADPENAERVYHSLAAFGAPLPELSPTDSAELGSFYQMGMPPVRVGVLMPIVGRLVHRKGELIRNKRAAGRHIDLHDAELLE